MTGTKVFLDGKQMTAAELAEHANAVYQISCGTANPFRESMFIPHNGDKMNPYRLSGAHCNCGCDTSLIGNPSLGEFDLLPLTDDSVQEGQKAYMKCRKCGGYSHL